jgi:hypothetical protein
VPGIIWRAGTAKRGATARTGAGARSRRSRLVPLALHARELYAQRQGTPIPQYDCARRFEPLVAPDALIVTSGGEDVDVWGNQNAANAAYFFFWMDRKGWSLPDSRQDIETLEEMRRLGARYYVAEKERLERTPGFQDRLRGRYRELAACEPAVLFELTD